MIYLYLVFQFVDGRCYGNQLILGKCHERRLIPLAFFALLFKNELQYYCLNVRANSSDDVAISCKNLVNFCLATPEKMVFPRIICSILLLIIAGCILLVMNFIFWVALVNF